jgi:hypothetical protein
MASISITIPDNYLSDVLDAFAHQYDYEQKKSESETKAKFAKRMVISNMKKIVENYLSIKAAELAREQASKDVDIMIL